MNKSRKNLRSRNLNFRLFHYAAFPLLSVMAAPVMADPFETMFEGSTNYTQNIGTNHNQNAVNYNASRSVISLPQGADIFDAALTAYTDLDTSSVDVSIARLESQSEEQAFNAEVILEVEASLEHTSTKYFPEEEVEGETNKIARSSVTLRKTLWDKAQDYAIDSAKNNIKTAQIKQFESQHLLAESVALAYLDYLAARDLTAATQRLNVLYRNLKHKAVAHAKSDDEVVDEIESQIKAVQKSQLKEKINLKRSSSKLYRLTNNNDFRGHSAQSYFAARNDISIGSKANLIDVAMSNNMELMSLYSERLSLQKNISAKRAGTSPKADFTSSISQEWISGDTELNSFDVSVGFNMEMPLYTGGRVNNAVKIAKLELLRAEREINQMKRQIASDISTLSNEFSGSRSSYKSLLKLYKRQVAENADLIRNNDYSNVDASNDLLDALDDEFELTTSLIREYYDLLKIKVEIMKITGSLKAVNSNRLRALLVG